ncbi:hypothetical protein BH11BAC6_BH11BAC6_01150 [soil metagenome]
MKRIIFLLILSANYTLTIAQPVKEHGQLKVVGTQLKDEHGNDVVLRGVSFGWHNFHPRFYNAGAVAWLHKDWDCSVVRAAMGVELTGGFVEKTEWSKEKIIAVADGAIKEGIYVIIDFHSHNIRLPEAKQFFTEMATRYAKYPNVIYELFNEPDYETWPEVKAYSTQIISTIRAIDPENIILVGSPNWDQYVNLPAADPITGFSNIMYTMHFYADTHKQELRDRTDAALQKGLPIFISECAGMSASGDGPLNMDEWNKWITWAETHKLSWVIWSVSDKNETCSVLQTSAADDGNWADKDLKESGIKTRELLRRYNGKQ